MKVCYDVCRMTSGSSEYRGHRQSEECPLMRDQNPNCKRSSCLWQFRIFTMCLTVMCFIMIAYLIFLHSVLGSTIRDFFDHGAVAADNINCSRIGTDILKEGGNAVDAAVGAMLCMTVVAPHKTGLGGGGIGMVYNGNEKGDPLVIDFATNTISGVLASSKIRIPSVIRGLEALHTLKGSLPWSKVIEPAEHLAKNGFTVTKHFADEISNAHDHVMLFGDSMEPGKILKLPHLGETLEHIKQHGAQSLYNGSLAHKFLRDEFHEIRDDFLSELTNYEPIKSTGIKSQFYDHVIYTPEHAELLRSILEKVDDLKIMKEEADSLEAQLEVAKVMVMMDVQDHNIEQERYTTVIAVDSNRNFVSILTGLSAPLGLGHMTGTGFLLDTVESKNNLHALTPIIYQSSKDPSDCSGALGVDDSILGTEIFSNIILRKLKLSIAIETQRYYKLSDGVLVEPSGKYPLDELLAIEISNLQPGTTSTIPEYVKSVNGIINNKNSLSSHSDSRGGGVASRYK